LTERQQEGERHEAAIYAFAELAARARAAGYTTRSAEPIELTETPVGHERFSCP